jgi:hypothetical protein
LAYVANNPELRAPLLMMALIGTIAYEYPVSLAILARQSFHGALLLTVFSLPA